jgi:hypothetical protein
MQTRKINIRTGDVSSEGKGGRKIMTKRNPDKMSFPEVYGPGATFHIRAIYPGRICTQLSLIGHDAQKNRVNNTPAITARRRYPPAIKSELTAME